MALLPVDTGTGVWRAVAAYAEQRRQELAAECCAVGTIPSRREELAARIAELDDLMAAPAQTRQDTEMRLNDQPRGVY